LRLHPKQAVELRNTEIKTLKSGFLNDCVSFNAHHMRSASLSFSTDLWSNPHKSISICKPQPTNTFVTIRVFYFLELDALPAVIESGVCTNLSKLPAEWLTSMWWALKLTQSFRNPLFNVLISVFLNSTACFGCNRNVTWWDNNLYYDQYFGRVVSFDLCTNKMLKPVKFGPRAMVEKDMPSIDNLASMHIPQ